MTGPLRDKHGNILRIRSDKERAKIARKKGGFDFSWIDKKSKKDILNTPGFFCKFCHKKYQDLITNHRTGVIILGCHTDGCPGNYAEKRSSWDPRFKKTIGRQIDKKLMFDFKKLYYGRHPSRLWATRKRTIH